MNTAKPFSPQTLAARWGCSSETVRTMCHSGAIGWFPVGKLIRIPAAEVERFECQNTPLRGIAESSPSLGESQAESIRFASRLARHRPKL